MKNQLDSLAREVSPAPAASCDFAAEPRSGLRRFPAACLEFLQRVKAKVTDNLAAEYAGVLDAETVRRVVNEADALAAITPFPTLFLPALAEEKVQAVSHWQSRQRAIQNRVQAFAA